MIDASNNSREMDAKNSISIYNEFSNIGPTQWRSEGGSNAPGRRPKGAPKCLDVCYINSIAMHTV